MTLETDKDISKLRQDKNITLEELSEAMRLPVSRIEFLEKGHFENEDKVILKLQLKNYAKFTGINYQTVLKLSGLDKKPENVEAKSYTVAVKKTHSYSGRKKQINPAVIYSFVVIAAI